MCVCRYISIDIYLYISIDIYLYGYISIDIYLHTHVHRREFWVQLVCFSVAFPANRGFPILGRTTVITSMLSHKQMAKQMILTHLTQDHPYLFHGCWPTDSSCPSLLHECFGREMAAVTHAHAHIHTRFASETKWAWKRKQVRKKKWREGDHKWKLWQPKSGTLWYVLMVSMRAGK